MSDPYLSVAFWALDPKSMQNSGPKPLSNRPTGLLRDPGKGPSTKIMRTLGFHMAASIRNPSNKRPILGPLVFGNSQIMRVLGFYVVRKYEYVI